MQNVVQTPKKRTIASNARNLPPFNVKAKNNENLTIYKARADKEKNPPLQLACTGGFFSLSARIYIYLFIIVATAKYSIKRKYFQRIS